MNFFEIIVMIFCTLVVAEFGIHVVYHAITGKAGLYDPPFQYLKDIWHKLRLYIKAKNIINGRGYAKIDAAYSLSYSDIYDFMSKENSYEKDICK